MKLSLGTKSTKDCPECGSVTVIEKNTDGTKTRRCDGLVDTHQDKPLDACSWSEEIHGNGKPITNP